MLSIDVAQEPPGDGWRAAREMGHKISQRDKHPRVKYIYFVLNYLAIKSLTVRFLWTVFTKTTEGRAYTESHFSCEKVPTF